MRLIPLTQGKFALVDDADFDWLNQWKWHAVKRHENWYACRTLKKIRMHRVILNLDEKELCDHIDRNGLNNQRANLRKANILQNIWNRGKYRRHSASSPVSSVFKGVYWAKDKRRWRAIIQIQGRRRNLGSFKDERLAAEAYDKMAAEIHGSFACLNFPLIPR